MKHVNIEHLRKIAATSDSQGGYCRLRAKRKLEVLENAEYKCETCGSKERLTIDHKVPFRELRKQYHTTRWSRIALQHCGVLCVECHLKKNAEAKNEL